MNLFRALDDNRFTLAVPLMKYDARTGEFEGFASIEELDKSGETIDIEKSWPYFQAWSASFVKATDGASYGNLREQHDPKKAAGKLTGMELTTFEGKPAIKVSGKAVDPGSKEKLLERVLVGLSIGGKYIEKDDSGRYVADPSEISLVDNPCVPNAMITVVKADGSETLAKALGFQPTQFWKCRNEHNYHEKKDEARECAPVGGYAEKLAELPEPLAKQISEPTVFETLTNELAEIKKSIESLRVPQATGATTTEVKMAENTAAPEAKEPETVAKAEDVAKAEVSKALDKLNATMTGIAEKVAAQDNAIKILTEYVGKIPTAAKGQLRAVPKADEATEKKAASHDDVMKATLSGAPAFAI